MGISRRNDHLSKYPAWAALLALLLLLSLLSGGCTEFLEVADAALEQLDSESETAGETTQQPDSNEWLSEDGSYTTVEEVSLYLHVYGRLPGNFMTKSEARELGWSGGSLEPYAPGKCIGGDRFGNFEGLLPEKAGRFYKECDIDTMGAALRGAKRLVFSNDGLIYYTEDHYESFVLLIVEAP